VDDEYRLDCSKSLHELKAQFTKTHFGLQCAQLLEGLDEAIAATTAVAPVRRASPYFTRRDGGRPSASSTEALWERALWAKYSDPEASPSVPGAWFRIVTYQLPLQDTRHDVGWGHIDLLGISYQGLPTVVELKRPSAHNVTPAQILIQAAAYALALRNAWTDGFAEQWNEAVSRRFGFTMPAVRGACPTIHLVGAAPTEYWQSWIGSSSKALAVIEGSWSKLATLVAALAERGMPATFVEVRHDGYDDQRSPLNLSCHLLDPFRLREPTAPHQ
jgi:hypothetical protein